MNGEIERVLGNFLCFHDSIFEIFIGFVCLKIIMVAPKQLTRIFIELREGGGEYDEIVRSLSERDRQNVLRVTVHFTFTITRWVDMGCDVQLDGVKSFSHFGSSAQMQWK